jgi:hypothetical protein
MDYPCSDFVGGGGSYDDSPPHEPDLIWKQELPTTVSEVKAHSTAHTQFENRNLPDSFRFKLWCVLIPNPVSEAPTTEASPSQFLIDNRDAFGNSLSDEVLLVTKVKQNGTLDFGFAAEVKRTMEYGETDLPALLFLREPRIKIYKSYQTSDLLKLKGQPLNGLAMTLGESSTDAVRRFMQKLPALLQGDQVPVDMLSILLQDSQSAATRDKLIKGGKKAGKAALTGGSTIVTIFSQVHKYIGHIHF